MVICRLAEFASSQLPGGRTDDNNAFFSQARGRYRAPYQFRTSGAGISHLPHTSGAENDAAGAPVVNVVTKSGSKSFPCSVFDYARDSAFDARQAL